MKNTLIEKAKEVMKSDFMQYPDYDPEIEITLHDAIVILIAENFEHDQEFNSAELFDFITEKIK
jgi:hypothetical protein